jgi:hypothetical protein
MATLSKQAVTSHYKKRALNLPIITNLTTMNRYVTFISRNTTVTVMITHEYLHQLTGWAVGRWAAANPTYMNGLRDWLIITIKDNEI